LRDRGPTSLHSRSMPAGGKRRCLRRRKPATVESYGGRGRGRLQKALADDDVEQRPNVKPTSRSRPTCSNPSRRESARSLSFSAQICAMTTCTPDCGRLQGPPSREPDRCPSGARTYERRPATTTSSTTAKTSPSCPRRQPAPARVDALGSRSNVAVVCRTASLSMAAITAASSVLGAWIVSPSTFTRPPSASRFRVLAARHSRASVARAGPARPVRREALQTKSAYCERP